MHKEYSFAVDLGGTTAKCAIIKDEKIIIKFIVPTLIGQVIENIHKHFLIECQKLKILETEFSFIGFTICGLIDYKKGISIWSGNLNWSNYPVLEKIKSVFKNENVVILNDSKAATFGEFILGIKKEKPNMLFYTIGTGIGGGVILNNNLYFGNNTGLASEPGHSGGFQNKFQCNCGLPGCVEGLSSATGIEKMLNENKAYFDKKLNQNLDKITIKDVSPLIKIKDEKTISIINECLLPLVKHIAVSIHLMDFDIVIIGGGPSALGDDLVFLLKKSLKNYLLKPFFDKLDLRMAKLQNDAGIWGIYHYAKTNFN